MINAVALRFDHVAEKGSQIRRIGGRAKLIGHYADLLPAFGKAEHGLYKVSAVGAKDPGNAHDEIFLHHGTYRQLTGQLCPAIDAPGRHGVLRLPGPLPLAGEYIVRGDIEQLAAQGGADGGKIGRAGGIHLPAARRLVLCPVHCRIGRAVDDGIGAIVPEHTLRSGPVGNVQLPGGDAPVLNTPGFQLPTDIVAQLAAGPGDKDFHRLISRCTYAHSSADTRR